MSEQSKKPVKVFLSCDPGGQTCLVWASVRDGKIYIARTWYINEKQARTGKINKIFASATIVDEVLIENFSLDQKKYGLTEKERYWADFAKTVFTEVEGLAHKYKITCRRIEPTLTGRLRKDFDKIWQKVGGEGEDISNQLKDEKRAEHFMDCLILIVISEFPEVVSAIMKGGGSIG